MWLNSSSNRLQKEQYYWTPPSKWVSIPEAGKNELSLQTSEKTPTDHTKTKLFHRWQNEQNPISFGFVAWMKRGGEHKLCPCFHWVPWGGIPPSETLASLPNASKSNLWGLSPLHAHKHTKKGPGGTQRPAFIWPSLWLQSHELYLTSLSQQFQNESVQNTQFCMEGK